MVHNWVTLHLQTDSAAVDLTCHLRVSRVSLTRRTTVCYGSRARPWARRGGPGDLILQLMSTCFDYRIIGIVTPYQEICRQ